jgi:hypothetical protein
VGFEVNSSGMWVQVIEPAGWIGPARLVTREQLFLRGDAAIARLQMVDAGVAVGTGDRLYGGQADPADASHFTIPFEMMGMAGAYDCRLGDDDRVRLDVADAKEFLARVMAALDEARAQRDREGR